MLFYCLIIQLIYLIIFNAKFAVSSLFSHIYIVVFKLLFVVLVIYLIFGSFVVVIPINLFYFLLITVNHNFFNLLSRFLLNTFRILYLCFIRKNTSEVTFYYMSCLFKNILALFVISLLKVISAVFAVIFAILGFTLNAYLLHYLSLETMQITPHCHIFVLTVCMKVCQLNVRSLRATVGYMMV